MIDMEINPNDRISELPDNIIHHILSFLSTKDVVRISVLSKMWHRIWASFPIWDFSESLVGLPDHYSKFGYSEEKARQMFFDFVEKSLRRQYHHNSSVQRFRISVDIERVASRIEHIIGLALQFGVKELDVEPEHDHPYLCLPFLFYMPQTIFSAKTLQVLRLSNCDFKLPLPCESLLWPSLEELSLRWVKVGVESIQKLISYCPFIKKLVLAQCEGLNKLELSGFTRLKNIIVEEVDYWRVSHQIQHQIQKIKIDLLSLRSFKYHGKLSEYQIDVTACKNLEVLSLSSGLTDRVCQEVVSKLPSLKSLYLRRFESLYWLSPLKKVKISSPQIEMLTLADVEEVVINAPNLLSFSYISHGIIPSVFSMEKSNLQEVRFWLHEFKIDADYLLEVRKHLGYFDKINLLYIAVPTIMFWSNFPRYSKDSFIPALLNIEQVTLCITQYPVSYVFANKIYNNLVDCLFWMCRPRRLLLPSAWCCNEDFMRVLCTTLSMHKVGGCDCCESSKGTKCWRNDLKGFHIERITGTGEIKRPTCDALLKFLPALAPYQTIRFVFKW